MTRFKIIIEGSALYADMKQVFEKVEELGFELTMVDNGNMVCDLGDGDSQTADYKSNDKVSFKGDLE